MTSSFTCTIEHTSAPKIDIGIRISRRIRFNKDQQFLLNFSMPQIMPMAPPALPLHLNPGCWYGGMVEQPDQVDTSASQPILGCRPVPLIRRYAETRLFFLANTRSCYKSSETCEGWSSRFDVERALTIVMVWSMELFTGIAVASSLTCHQTKHMGHGYMGPWSASCVMRHCMSLQPAAPSTIRLSVRREAGRSVHLGADVWSQDWQEPITHPWVIKLLPPGAQREPFPFWEWTMRRLARLGGLATSL